MKRAGFTRLAIGCNVLLRLLDAVTRQIVLLDPEAQTAAAVSQGCSRAIAWLYWVAGIGFLYWAHRLVRVVRALDGQALRWRPTDAVWGFVIPILNFWRPYQILRDVQQLLVRDEVPEPAPQPLRTGETGCRAMAFEPLPPAKPVSDVVRRLRHTPAETLLERGVRFG